MYDLDAHPTAGTNDGTVEQFFGRSLVICTTSYTPYSTKQGAGDRELEGSQDSSRYQRMGGGKEGTIHYKWDVQFLKKSAFDWIPCNQRRKKLSYSIWMGQDAWSEMLLLARSLYWKMTFFITLYGIGR